LQRIRLLRNPIRHYAWGSRTLLADLMGRSSPSDEPEAELWMGSHPAAPSWLEDDAGERTLGDWLADDPAGRLGADVSERFEGELPFLFKVLAPEQALSIQAHPDARQAREGFARENAAGIPLDAPHRLYRDPHPKPELICALEPFHVLCGFRARDEITAGLAALEVPSLDPDLRALASGGPADGLARLLAGLLERDAPERRALAGEVAAAARSEAAAHVWVRRLAEQHPGDPSVLAPLLLNLLTLEPGQALFLGAGEIHAYLGGLAVELMANSDNVLRGGLTPKHVDVAELLRTLTFREGPPPVLEARPVSPGVARYETPAREFALSRLRPRPGAPVPGSESRGAEILLCVAGAVAVVVDDEAPVALRPGQAAFVPADARPYRVEGDGEGFRAGVPM